MSNFSWLLLAGLRHVGDATRARGLRSPSIRGVPRSRSADRLVAHCVTVPAPVSQNRGFVSLFAAYVRPADAKNCIPQPLSGAGEGGNE
jgi:hypothetical protein